MKNVIKLMGLGHINIVVDSIDLGIKFYQNIFGAVPYQIFKNFKNIGFAKAAGFLESPEEVELSIAFLNIPNCDLVIELMEYITPKTENEVVKKPVNVISGVRHVALKITDIQQAFNYINKQDGIQLINESIDYRPFKIDNIESNEFSFFNLASENNKKEKQMTCDIIGNTKYFYFIDKYGVQWELEEGHTDI